MQGDKQKVCKLYIEAKKGANIGLIRGPNFHNKVSNKPVAAYLVHTLNFTAFIFWWKSKHLHFAFLQLRNVVINYALNSYCDQYGRRLRILELNIEFEYIIKLSIRIQRKQYYNQVFLYKYNRLVLPQCRTETTPSNVCCSDGGIQP